MDCSVIIPTYNRRDLLRYTLKCLINQKNPGGSFEVIVVDDGSTDDSPYIVREFQDLLDLRYIWKPDRGFRVAEARNLGIKLARGNIIVFLDCGVLAGNDFIRSHIIEHQRTTSPAVVIGYVYGFNEGGRISSELANLLDHCHVENLISECQLQTGYNDIRDKIYSSCRDELEFITDPWCLFWTCNASVTKELLFKVGLFDEEFKSWGGEDIELGYRLYKDGARYVLCRAAVAIHYPHDTIKRSQLDAFVNYRRFSRKHKLEMSAIVGKNLMRDMKLLDDIAP